MDDSFAAKFSFRPSQSKTPLSKGQRKADVKMKEVSESSSSEQDEEEESKNYEKTK